MAITIRDADLQRDRNELIRFLYENLAPVADASRFDWLYLGSPYGPARAWIGMNELGQTVGVAAAFPREFWVAERPERVWVLGDFCIAREYRTLGPALSLQRACLETLGRQEHAICYDFPSQSMLAIYRRLGISPLGQHVRYVKLLKAGETVRRFVRSRFLAAPLIEVGNWTLGLRRRSRIPEGITFSLHEEEFAAEFDAVDDPGAGRHLVKGQRNAEYLNWRYLKHPLKPYCVITARKGAELLGYGIVEVDGPQAVLAELRTTDAENTIPGILAYVETVLKEMEVESLNASLFESCYLVPFMRRAGFYPRESASVVAYTNGTESRPGILDPQNWLLLAGDRDS